jgi:hypothetical protein
MGKVGMRRLYWSKFASEPTSALPTYLTGKLIGVGIAADVTYNWATGELYGDDKLIEKINEISSATAAVQTSYLSLQDMSDMYGQTYADGELGIGTDDNPPYGGLGYIQVLKNTATGATVYRAFFWPKVSAQMGNETANTKAGSITIGTFTITWTAFKPAYGKIAYVKDFTTEEAAAAYLETKLNIAAWHQINVLVSGATTGEAATPGGITMIANAGTFTLVITGTVTKLYDNGTDVTVSIADGEYELSNVTAAHNIAVIF